MNEVENVEADELTFCRAGDVLADLHLGSETDDVNSYPTN